VAILLLPGTIGTVSAKLGLDRGSSRQSVKGLALGPPRGMLADSALYAGGLRGEMSDVESRLWPAFSKFQGCLPSRWPHVRHRKSVRASALVGKCLVRVRVYATLALSMLMAGAADADPFTLVEPVNLLDTTRTNRR
jgi:hypothetical protein